MPDEWPDPLPLRLLVYRVLRGEEECLGEDRGASACPKADMLSCTECGHRWKVDDPSILSRCPTCNQNGAVAEYCDGCPAAEVEYYRANTATGLLLNRVLEHEFDTKHYRIDPGSVSAEVREGLKILHYERARWEKETREEAEREREEQQRIREMQRRAGR